MELSELKKEYIADSAVLVLYEQISDSLILTKRSKCLRTHPGEICFPGGGWQPGDKNLYATALRELYEELGIGPDRVSLIRQLQVERVLSGSIIQPWFTSIKSIVPYQINDKEVEQIVIIPMSLVQRAENYREIIIERNGDQFSTCEFIPDEHWIWGATARIMQQLIIPT